MVCSTESTAEEAGGVEEGQTREGVTWWTRVYIDTVTKHTSRLWVRDLEVFPDFRFTSRQVWGTHRRPRGEEDRWPEGHREEPEQVETNGTGRRVRRKPDYFEAGEEDQGKREVRRDWQKICEANRLAQVECGEGCSSNRKLTEQIWDDFEVCHMGEEKGWGLKTRKGYREGETICEYTGRIQTQQENEERERDCLLLQQRVEGAASAVPAGVRPYKRP